MIGVIADDLTGAAELGAVGVRYGFRAEVVVEGEAGKEADLVCVDTDSRSAVPTQAGARAATAATVLLESGATRVYKKVDSVLRGNVLVEIESILRQLRLPRALLLPANPGLGRVIRQGNYYVGGKPVHETDFRFDPEHPRRTSAVRDLLGTAGLLPVHMCDFSEPLPATGIIVGETSTAADLCQWANRCDAATLAVGGAEFFAAWLEAGGRTIKSSPQADAVTAKAEPELFVCGSASEATAAFVAESRKRGVLVFGLPAELAGGAEFGASACDQLAEEVRLALGSNPRVLLRVGLPPVSDHDVARHLVTHLTVLAQVVLSRAKVGHVFAEGGATAASLVRRMGWKRLEVLREISPGVVTLRVVGGGRDLLTMKPGSYAWPAELWR